MYLEPWMIICIVIAFGICAVWNKAVGFNRGMKATLQVMIDEKFIRITEEGDVVKY